MLISNFFFDETREGRQTEKFMLAIKPQGTSESRIIRPNEQEEKFTVALRYLKSLPALASFI